MAAVAGSALSIRSMTIFPGCAPCSVIEPSVGSRVPISQIALRARSCYATWGPALRIGCGEIRSTPDTAIPWRSKWCARNGLISKSSTVPLGPEDLLELDADFRASLQPYVRLLALQYPVDDLRIQVRRTSEDRGAASNTALKQKHRTMTERGARSNPTQSSSLRIGWITPFII